MSAHLGCFLIFFLFIAKGKRNQDDQEEQINHSDEKLIKKVCRDNFQADTIENQRCQEELKNLETISRQVEELCQELSINEEADRKKCHKTAQICEKAVQICESRNRFQSNECQEKKESCQSLVKGINL